ncbi:MAG: hypothetical protein ACTSQ8_17420 [Candidatus Helarchaeota archaeon]
MSAKYKKRKLKKFEKELLKILKKRLAVKLPKRREAEIAFTRMIIELFSKNPEIKKISLPSSIVSSFIQKEELGRMSKDELRKNFIGIKHKKMIPKEVKYLPSRIPEVYTFFRKDDDDDDNI